MQDRIIKITDYFKGLEICEGIVVIKITFPVKWVIPSDELLDELFKVKVVKNRQDEGYFYCCEIANGVTPAFDAIDFTIEFNHNLEEKSELLKVKVDELKQLFAEKPIEVLRTIEFKYIDKKNKTKRSKKSENETLTNENEEYTQQIIDNNDCETTTIVNTTPVVDDNLMDYAKNLVK